MASSFSIALKNQIPLNVRDGTHKLYKQLQYNNVEMLHKEGYITKMDSGGYFKNGLEICKIGDIYKWETWTVVNGVVTRNFIAFVNSRFELIKMKYNGFGFGWVDPIEDEGESYLMCYLNDNYLTNKCELVPSNVNCTKWRTVDRRAVKTLQRSVRAWLAKKRASSIESISIECSFMNNKRKNKIKTFIREIVPFPASHAALKPMLVRKYPDLIVMRVQLVHGKLMLKFSNDAHMCSICVENECSHVRFCQVCVSNHICDGCHSQIKHCPYCRTRY